MKAVRAVRHEESEQVRSRVFVISPASDGEKGLFLAWPLELAHLFKDRLKRMDGSIRIHVGQLRIIWIAAHRVSR